MVICDHSQFYGTAELNILMLALEYFSGLSSAQIISGKKQIFSIGVAERFLKLLATLHGVLSVRGSIYCACVRACVWSIY